MSVRRAWHKVAEEIAAVAGNLRAADAAAETLERRASGPGGSGGGGVGAQNLAGSIAGAPTAGTPGAGMPDLTGTTVRIGGGDTDGSSSGNQGGDGGGIRNVETNRDKIGAIVEAAGVAPPDEGSWDENGTGPGEFPGFIITAVLELGTSSPRRYLVWCAGWLVYSAVVTTPRVGARGQGGRGTSVRGRDRGNFGNPDWAGDPGVHDDPNFGNYNWAGSATHSDPNFGNPSWAGSSTQASSIAGATRESASQLAEVNNQLRQLNNNIMNPSGGVGARTGR